MDSKPFVFEARLVRVIDGDTVIFTLLKKWEMDFGFKFTSVHNAALIVTLRLYGINTPELHSGDHNEVTRAKAAKVALEALLTKGALRVESIKAGEETTDKFGRYLAKIFVKPTDGDEFEIGPTMIAMGHALPYFGVGPKPV